MPLLPGKENLFTKALSQRILRMSHTLKVPRGHYLYLKGDKPQHLTILMRGAVVLAGPTVRHLELMPRGKIMGLKEMILDEDMKQTAFASTATTLMVVSRDEFMALVNGSPEFRRMCMQHICQQLVSTQPQRVYE